MIFGRKADKCTRQMVQTMKNNSFFNCQVTGFADSAVFACIYDTKIPVQELGGQRGEGASFQKDTVCCTSYDTY